MRTPVPTGSNDHVPAALTTSGFIMPVMSLIV